MHLQHRLDSIVYPVLTLPVEIVSEIFVSCLADVPVSVDASVAPLLLTRVCTQWRSIALRTPKLWSILAVESHSLRDAGFVETWLRRADNTPLTLDLCHFDPNPFPGGRARNRKIFLPVMARAPQWRDVCVHFPAAMCEVYFLFINRLPKLRKLEIRSMFQAGQEHYSSHAGLDMFSDAPELREVNLYGMIPPAVFNLPWHQLTTFRSMQYSASECMTVLSLAPQLVTCEFIDVQNAELSGFRDLPPHHSLQDLTIDATASPDDAHPPVQILRFLRLPALRALDLVYTPAEDAAWFLPMLKNAPELRTFRRAYHETGMDDPLVSYLGAMSGLVSVDIAGEARHMNEVMRLVRGSPSFLPRVQDMQLRILGMDVSLSAVSFLVLRQAKKIMDEIYRNVAEALFYRRVPRVELGLAKLESFQLFVPLLKAEPYAPRSAIFKKLSSLKTKRGMDISIRTGPVYRENSTIL
ncbi:hypothetical protein B0H10DRAFT_1978226 [Mycena sp. CBHHK59/15]|nr:hypothetical protein B0H10DRAFT_1978226 [Mycena sp. CBHHK59/15]